MILSVSRRTDIPAFYSDWFLRRVREGFVMVRNPMDHRQVSRISLDPSVVDWLVFWTKNAQPFLDRLSEVRERYGENFCFQYTLAAYDASVEPRVPPLETRIEAFQKLSDRLGPDRVVWRYDPIVFAPSLDLDFHKRRFEELARRLGPCTRRCVVSLLDTYRKSERNLAGLGVAPPSESDLRDLLSHIAQVLAFWSIPVESCAESVDFSDLGVRPGKCIDDRLISRLRGVPWTAAKDKGQRPACGCIPSIDIGAYNTCPHGCRYCYANFSGTQVDAARRAYDPDSPLLCDALRIDDEIKERPMKSLFTAQEGLWG